MHPLHAQRKSGTLTMALPGEPSCRWLLLCIDLAAAAAGAGGAAFASLRSVQLCSRMAVRGVFTSDIKFGLNVRARQLCSSARCAHGLFVSMHALVHCTQARRQPYNPRALPAALAVAASRHGVLPHPGAGLL